MRATLRGRRERPGAPLVGVTERRDRVCRFCVGRSLLPSRQLPGVDAIAAALRAYSALLR